MKKPPRYGVELSEMTRKLFQWALLVHLLFAFFMFSNVHIFSDSQMMRLERASSTHFTFIGSLFKSSTRLTQKHSQVYIAFLIAIYVLFFLYKVAEYLYETFRENNREASQRFCRCQLLKSLFLLCKRQPEGTAYQNEEEDNEGEPVSLSQDQIVKKEQGEKVTRRTSKIYKEKARFSNSIYEEMQIDEIKREYIKTVAERQQYEEALRNGTLQQTEDVEYVMRRLAENIETMRALAEKWAKEDHIVDPSSDPAECFDQLFHTRKHDPRHRLTGLYCYDVGESETFKNTFKAE